MILTATDITKTFEGKLALDDVSLDVEQGEIVCLLGPSGCGKTTLLRIIAGLTPLDAGRVHFEGDDITEVSPHQRDFGLMFQDYALFPHKNVFENVAFGLRMTNQREDIAGRVQEVLDLVGMGGFAERSVNDLSGGEAQRVALARSLAPSPRLLMLDEPLGALDRALRERLMLDLRDILKRVAVTAIYVTHDQAEAFAISDRVVVMNKGHIEQQGPPEEIYRQPATPFVAKFLGLTNLAEGKVIGNGCVEAAWGTLAATTDGHNVDAAVTVLIRPEAAQLIDTPVEADGGPPSIKEETTHNKGNLLHGTLEMRSFRGGRYQVKMQPEQGPPLTFELFSAEALSLSPGDAITVEIDSAGVVLL